VRLLQVSTVHVYLTYPFVLSWSVLEAMSACCAIVASDTPPLHEAIRPGDTGRLAGFFDRDALVAEVGALLDDPGTPLELIRQWLDFGFWYDRKKQTTKYVKDVLLMASMSMAMMSAVATSSCAPSTTEGVAAV
jgi:glycosyltransferase involved in cell wall biosynthesis